MAEFEQSIGQEGEELELMKQRLQEMQEASSRLEEEHAQVAKELGEEGGSKDADSRSIYVGNVDYGSTPEEIQAHFQSCGTINRVTILCDKWTGHPKGFAYVEFADAASVSTALSLNDSMFRSRLLKVSAKRTNVPGLSARGGFRGRGRGAPYGAGGFHAPNPYANPYGGFAPTPFYRGRGGGFRGGFRGRGRGRGQPY